MGRAGGLTKSSPVAVAVGLLRFFLRRLRSRLSLRLSLLPPPPLLLRRSFRSRPRSLRRSRLGLRLGLLFRSRSSAFGFVPGLPNAARPRDFFSRSRRKPCFSSFTWRSSIALNSSSLPGIVCVAGLVFGHVLVCDATTRTQA